MSDNKNSAYSTKQKFNYRTSNMSKQIGKLPCLPDKVGLHTIVQAITLSPPHTLLSAHPVLSLTHVITEDACCWENSRPTEELFLRERY